MGLHKLSAGDGYRYLTRQVAADDGVVPAGGLGTYYAERGESPGQWVGSGLRGLGIEPGARVREAQMVALFGHGRHPDADVIELDVLAAGGGIDDAINATNLGTPFPIAASDSGLTGAMAERLAAWNSEHGAAPGAPVPADVRAQIRTEAARELFAHAHGRGPQDATELASFVASNSRRASSAVAGYDLTFSPVKSVSALWAVAPEPIAAQIRAAHEAAVADTMAWLERCAAYTRLGKNGIRQVQTRGLVAAAFVHRDSRAGDPDLHTHVAVSNKVETTDGRWRALDGRVMHKAAVAASERYNTRLEAQLRERLGLAFAERPGRGGRRPVREIAGVDERLIRFWSSRRAAIDMRRAQLSDKFQAEHGRPPTPVEAIALAQQATLETRHGKHAPRSETQQRQSWRTEAIRVLGEQELHQLLAQIVDVPDRRVDVGAIEFSAAQARRVAGAVIEVVQAERATWQTWHVRAEAERQLRTYGIPLAELDAAVDSVVDVAIAECSMPIGEPEPVIEPAALRRSDGSSIYAVAGSQLYTSSEVLTAEQQLLEAGRRVDGRRADETVLNLALLETAANDVPLTDGQAGFVHDLAVSGARVQVGLAPAGTGKTTALRTLARAWADDGGTIIGLAPSAAAARVLRDAIAAPCDTLAKYLHANVATEVQTGSANPLIAVDENTLVLVDEAGMAATLDLAQLVQHVLARGGSVRLVGDDRQLAAVGSGGILRDLVETTGAASLSTPLRFTDPAEAEATLAIRDGNPTALEFYQQNRRILVGDEHTALDSAYRAWAADRADGRDTLLLAATRDQVTVLNQHARTDRLHQDGQPTQESQLADGTAASAGDPVITRRNNRRLAISATDWVKNGDRFSVHAVGPDGSLNAVHRDSGRHVSLPADYVRNHVQLGYAATIHCAQGITADTCHTVLTGRESREQLYVALTRGRSGNHLHLVLPGAADQHAPIRHDTLLPPTAEDLLRRILDTDNTPRSASSETRDFADPARRLRDAVARYQDAINLAPVPERESVMKRPLPWLPAIPVGTDDAWTTYLDARAEQITSLAAAVADHATNTRHVALTPHDPALVGDLAVWIAVHGNMRDQGALTEAERQHRKHLEHRLDIARVRLQRDLYRGTAHLRGRAASLRPGDAHRAFDAFGNGRYDYNHSPGISR